MEERKQRVTDTTAMVFFITASLHCHIQGYSPNTETESWARYVKLSFLMYITHLLSMPLFFLSLLVETLCFSVICLWKSQPHPRAQIFLGDLNQNPWKFYQQSYTAMPFTLQFFMQLSTPLKIPSSSRTEYCFAYICTVIILSTFYTIKQ